MRAEQVDLAARALSGPPTVVLVSGLAGMGKSWFVRQVLEHPLLRARDVVVVEDVALPLPTPGSLMITYRPEEFDGISEIVSRFSAPVRVVETVIEPLSAGEIMELLGVSADAAAELLADTGGVPRFLLEGGGIVAR